MDSEFVKTLLEFLFDKLQENPTTAILSVVIVFLLFIIYLFVDDPERIDKLKAFVLKPIFNYLGIASRQYIAARIGSSVTSYIKRNYSNLISSIDYFKFKIKWVSSAKDPILKRDGTVILHLQESKDQTINILTATKAALPKILCPSLRNNIDEDYKKAIDLTFLKSTADSLGKHAHQVFQKIFLENELSKDSRVPELFENLVELDNFGIFVSIFLHELNALGERLYSCGITEDKSESIEQLLNFLIKFPRRKESEEIDLNFVNDDFSLAIVLVAKSDRAKKAGTQPYISRIDKNIKTGYESIYLYAYPQQIKFLENLTKRLKEDNSLLIKSENKLIDNNNKHNLAMVVCIERNLLNEEIPFVDLVVNNNITVNDKVEGRVLEVSSELSQVNVLGLKALIKVDDCSWYTIKDCSEVLALNAVYEFKVKKIDQDKSLLILSMKSDEHPYWDEDSLPELNNRINAKIMDIKNNNFICKDGNIEILLPLDEVSWTQNETLNYLEMIGKEAEILIIEKNQENKKIIGSIKQLNDNPWSSLQHELPGQIFTGKVVSINENMVNLLLDNQLEAFITDEEMKLAGHEYADYQNNLMVGSGLDVVIDRVFRDRKKIRVRLTRNVETK